MSALQREQNKRFFLAVASPLQQGSGTDLVQDGSIYGRWNFLRVAGVTVGLYAEGGTRGEGKVQLSVGYKW
jgi:hypothetical protein